LDYDVIIIGAGMSGLAAGIRLAHYGKKVCILESHFVAGGLNSYYQRGGHEFDVGLHAMTNYAPPGTKQLLPFVKILRQLRIKHEDFGLFEQNGSQINFDGAVLNFNNDFEYFKQQVHSVFPAQKDNFEKFVNYLKSYNELDLNSKPQSAREITAGFINDELLIEMLFCPLSYYGSAVADDMEFGQFVVMFKSIFLEGFSRPYEGVRRIIFKLEERFRESGGILRLRTRVEKINISNNKVASLILSDGSEIRAPKILSTIGHIETLKICSDFNEKELKATPGELAFTEVILLLNERMENLNHDKTIIFYNNSRKFVYRKPETLVNYESGVICCPNNFKYSRPLSESILRITNMANCGEWEKLSKPDYKKEKDSVLFNAINIVKSYVPAFNENMIKFSDVFTPLTVRRFTGHINGAVYGSPDKLKNGVTHIDNLFICGTDQGFLGIIGAILSGISIANLHFLMRE